MEFYIWVDGTETYDFTKWGLQFIESLIQNKLLPIRSDLQILKWLKYYRIRGEYYFLELIEGKIAQVMLFSRMSPL